MIRKRNEIDFDIKAKKATLNKVIENSLKLETECDEKIVNINEELSELASEICFEETLEGEVVGLEQDSFKKIDKILKDLSKTTGKHYALRSEPVRYTEVNYDLRKKH